ncbi:hypothetical protein [uncultured Algibacter sp.]|uniref:hypothetical protein n=1 Tax=uncultured Algibacter sp. TaxID=298659 RepID=UPI0026095910|nr:hypothetical protein [uncultured Algibacter sp.]
MFFILKAQTSELLRFDRNGKLIYVADNRGNKIPDYSYVGYHHSEKSIPNIPIRKTINAIKGDNRSHIQNAIDELETLKPDKNGFRGALLLKSGTYNVSGVLKIKKSGIVIRGEGKSTTLIATKKSKSNFVVFEGYSEPEKILSTQTKIIDSYVPIGAQAVTAIDGHSFEKGDDIMIERKPNQAWIDMLGMDDLNETDSNDRNWTPNRYTVTFRRKVLSVKKNKISFDAPIVDIIDSKYAEGYIYKYSWKGKIEEVGIENIQLNSYYASPEDENHAWNAVIFNNVENGWAKKVYANYFTYSCINIGRSSMKITVDSCEMRNHKGIVKGGRMYSFNVVGEQNLIKNCITEGGRHDYVTASIVAGPNVFLNSKALDAHSVSGPHHRWSTGLLFDNIYIEGDNIGVENRRNSGSGHGWSGASCMFWNCSAKEIIIQDPPGDHTNWAIGCLGEHTNKGCCGPKQSYAHKESMNVHVKPESLFEKQLEDRLSVSE